MGGSAKVGGQGAQSLGSIMGLIPGLQSYMPSPQGIFGTGGQGFGTVLGPGSQPQQSMWDPGQAPQMDLAPLLQMMQPRGQAGTYTQLHPEMYTMERRPAASGGRGRTVGSSIRGAR